MTSIYSQNHPRLKPTDVTLTPQTHTGIFSVAIKGVIVGRAIVTFRASIVDSVAKSSIQWSLFVLESKHIYKGDSLLRCVEQLILENPRLKRHAMLGGTPNEER